MLQLQANEGTDSGLNQRLTEAANRVAAVGHAYERLAFDFDYGKIDLGGYLRELVADLEKTVSPCQLLFEATGDVKISADRAISVALIINELVSNAAKHAYASTQGGCVWVRLVSDEQNAVLIYVRDEGIGLPADFDPGRSRRLGARLVAALTKQLGAQLNHQTGAKGVEFELVVPLQTSNAQDQSRPSA
jgi:two-component sensor histidine kinase